MTADDIDFGMHLSAQAGWNQTRVDWLRTLDLEPEGCFVAEFDGRRAGTTTICRFDSIAWIAMVLVEKSLRGRGIGTRLVGHALEHLDAHGLPTVRLDATPLGRPIYRRLGFVEEYDLARLEGTSPGGSSNDSIVPVTAELIGAVIDLDRRITGTHRRRLLGRLWNERPDAARAYVADGEALGYVMFRRGTRATQIGPLGAMRPEVGAALGDWALGQCTGQPVFIDVPCENTPATQWATDRDLAPQRNLARMVRGRPVHDHPEQLWASFGPEKG